MKLPAELVRQLDAPGVEEDAVQLCAWLERHDWDFKVAAEGRGTTARALYREWLASLGWNQSLAARLYRKPGSKRRGVTRQAIEAQMKALGVVRPLDLGKQLATQDVEGAVDAMRSAAAHIEATASRERLCAEQLLALADTWRVIGDHGRARGALVDVVKLARMSGSPDLAARAIHALPYLDYQASRYGGYDAELVDVLEGWLPVLRAKGDQETVALCLGRLGIELYRSDVPTLRDRAEPLVKEAYELSREVASPRTRATLGAWRILSISGPDHLDERLGVLIPMVAESAFNANAEDRYFALDMFLTDLIEAGRVNDIPPVLAELRELEGRCSAPWPQRYRVTLAILEGRWEEASRLSVLPEGTRAQSAAQVRGLQQFEVLKLRGDWENLYSLTRWNANQEPGFIGYRFALAQIACLMGQLDGVNEELDAWADQGFACVPTDFLRTPNLCMLAEVCHTVDRPEHAATLLALLEPYATRFAIIRVTASIQGPVARYTGLLLATLERYDEAIEHLEQAVARCESLGARPYAAWTRYDLARVLRRAGLDTQRAEREAAAAAHEATRLEMPWLAGRARALGAPGS